MGSDGNMTRRMLVDDHGSTFAEYGLVFFLVAMIVLVLAVIAGGGAFDFFQQVEPIG